MEKIMTILALVFIALMIIFGLVAIVATEELCGVIGVVAIVVSALMGIAYFVFA